MLTTSNEQQPTTQYTLHPSPAESTTATTTTTTGTIVDMTDITPTPAILTTSTAAPSSSSSSTTTPKKSTIREPLAVEEDGDGAILTMGEKHQEEVDQIVDYDASKEGRVVFKGALLPELPTEVLELNDAIDSLGFGRYQVFVAVICGVIMALDAAELLVISFFFPYIKRVWGLSTLQQLIITGATYAGMGVGNYFWGWLSDKVGRRPVLSAIPFIGGIGCLVSAFSVNYLMLAACRFFVGIGVGAYGVAFNLFAEFLPTNVRGKLLSLFQGVWTIGICYQAMVIWIVLPNLGWRAFLGIAGAPYFLLMCVVPWMPESARFYLVHHKAKKAWEVIKKVSRINKTAMLPGMLIDIAAPKGKLLDLLSPTLRRLTLLLWSIFFCNNIMYYGLVMFTPVYFSAVANSVIGEEDTTTSSAALALSSSAIVAIASSAPAIDTMEFAENLIASVAEFPGVIIQTVAIEKLGRKRLQALMMGCAAVTVLPLVIPGIPEFLGLFLCFLSRMFSIAALQTAWVFAPESYPTSVRTTGMGTANTIGKSASLLSPLMSTYLYDAASWAPVLIIGIAACVGAVSALLLPFDTANRGMSDNLQQSSNSNNSNSSSSGSSGGSTETTAGGHQLIPTTNEEDHHEGDAAAAAGSVEMTDTKHFETSDGVSTLVDAASGPVAVHDDDDDSVDHKQGQQQQQGSEVGNESLFSHKSNESMLPAMMPTVTLDSLLDPMAPMIVVPPSSPPMQQQQSQQQHSELFPLTPTLDR